MSSARIVQLLCCFFLIGFLSGCSNTDMSDLHAQIEQIKQSQKGKVAPLPEFTPIESYAYAMKDGADPFLSWVDRAAKTMQTQQKKARKSNGLQPDMSRRREPLEQFPLDTLRMVGTLEREGESAALVTSPDGLVSRVLAGNYLGQNHGRVISILMDKVEIMEIVPDGLGGWQRRPASLAIVQTEKK